MSDYTSDPYAGGGSGPKRNAGGGEVRSQVDQFAQRLRNLGATPDEVDPVVASWDDLDPPDTKAGPGEPPPWTAARRAALVSAPDAELLGLIEAARDEYAYATTTEAQANDADKRAALARIDAGAAAVVGRSVADVLAWVDGDPDRARAVLALETAPGEGGNRKTLVEPLRALVGGGGTPEATEAAPGPQVGPGGQPDAPTE